MEELELELEETFFTDNEDLVESEPVVTPNNDIDVFEDNNIEPLDVDPVLNELLKQRGITDGRIKIIDEDNIEKNILFSDLTLEEQVAILTESPQPKEKVNYDPNDSNLAFINTLEEKGMTIKDFLDQYESSILEQLNVDSYEIDEYNDHELFVLDLKNKYDLTDDELVKELERELEDEVLFKKKVDILRKEYKDLEDKYKEANQIEYENNKRLEYETFAENIVNIASNTPEFYGIELEDNEKEEVLSFLLDLDQSGKSQFYKTLNDPNKLYEAAWFLRYGKESFDALKNAYEAEINRLKKDGTKVIRENNNHKHKKNIHDLY